MSYLIPFILAYSVYLYNYKKVLGIRKELKKIKLDMADEKIWEKLDKLTDRVTSIEVKLAGLNARMTFIFGGVGVAIQLLFKYIVT